MKFPKLFLLPLLLTGCNSTPPVKIVDDRPAAELSFVKKLHLADSLFSAEANEIKKTEVYEKQKTELTKFITDSLNTGVKQWQAHVYSIEVADNIEVTLLISKNKFFDLDEKYPQFNSMVLFSTVPLNDSPIKTSLKKLLKGDRVLVTGTFEKNEAGNVDLDSFTDDIGNRNGYIFTNPKLGFKIESISKQGN